jgi:hypothetical protein
MILTQTACTPNHRHNDDWILRMYVRYEAAQLIQLTNPAKFFILFSRFRLWRGYLYINYWNCNSTINVKLAVLAL